MSLTRHLGNQSPSGRPNALPVNLPEIVEHYGRDIGNRPFDAFVDAEVLACNV